MTFNKSKCRVMHMTHKKTCACLPTCMREVPLVPRGRPKIDVAPLNVHWTLRGGRGFRGLPVDVKEKTLKMV